MELFKDNGLWKYGFGLTAHEVTIKFVAAKQEDALKWCTKLARLCKIVCLHLSKNFIVGKMLSRGSYSKVNQGVNIQSGTAYTIKSIAKSRLLEKPKTIVKLH